MPKEKLKPCSEMTCPSWMCSMGDCMSLMLTFFVLLMSFSTVAEDQLMEVSGCVQGALGILPKVNISASYSESAGSNVETENQLIDSGDSSDSYEISEEQVSPVVFQEVEIMRQYYEYKNKVNELGYPVYLDVKRLDNGIAFTLAEELFEDPKLATSRGKIMEVIANIIVNSKNEISITCSFAETELDFTEGWKALSNMMSAKYKTAVKIKEFFITKYHSIEMERFRVGVKVISRITEEERLEKLSDEDKNNDRKNILIVLEECHKQSRISLKNLVNLTSQVGDK